MGQNSLLRPYGVSVIICCYNSANNILSVLEHIELQQRVSFQLEVIVVNNNSKDDTDTLVNNFIKETNLDVKLVFESKPGLMYAREKGLQESKYEFIQFCDDDNLLSPNYILNVYNILNDDPSVGACGGKGIALVENKKPIWFKKYSRAYAVGSQLKNPQDHLYGAGMAIRYSALKNVYDKGFKSFLTGRKGGFLLAGDDGELVLALLLRGYKIIATDEIYFHHIIPKERLSVEYLIKLHVGFGMMYPVIDIYRSVLKTKKVRHVFYYDLLFFKKALKSMLLVLMRKGLERTIQISLLKGNLKGAYYFFNKKSKVIQVINKIYNDSF